MERQGGSNQPLYHEDGEEGRGDLPGYTPTLENLRLQEVYGDWVHANPGTYLHGRIRDDETWQEWLRDLAVMPSWRYGAPSRKVGRRFVVALVEELRRVWDRRYNLERFIAFQMVILKQARHVNAYQAICQRIEKRLEAWEAVHHDMLTEDTLCTCTQYLTAARREDSNEHRAKTYHSLVLQGKLRTAVRWIMEQETGCLL